MTMLFNFGKKAAEKTATPAKAPVKGKAAPAGSFQVNKGTANKGTYVPDGLTPEQYSKFLAAEASKKVSAKTKFPLGKNVETLTEWMLEEEKLGNSGKDLLKRHRLVKCKYDGWYTDESPV
ncbi:hypothetical protein B484DRAFT_437544 [Ochromonadaceae sp. CCMP2298]|nr:hypothetical protein B484DRAFT_437544 [Ochromonadaceae sp. CCMP2298]